MVLNKVKGNMYPWVTHTWNPVAGECLHRCSYCYMKKGRAKDLKKYHGETRLDEKCMRDNLGSGNTIFVGSATDMFGKWVSDEDIQMVLDYCKQFDNRYLFQSKNPIHFVRFGFPANTILGTTIETNRASTISSISKAPNPAARVTPMDWITIEKMVSIEPIMDFDLGDMICYIKRINPSFVSIGADSKNSNLPEPSSEKVTVLVRELRKFTEVKIKENLGRLI